MEPEHVVREALGLLNQGDLDAYHSRMADDVSYRTPITTVEGRDAVRGIDEATFSQMDHHRDVVHLLVDGAHVCCWLSFSGQVHRTGKAFEVDMCAMFRVEDDRIASLSLYADFAPLMAAMV